MALVRYQDFDPFRGLLELQQELDSANPHVAGFELPGATVTLIVGDLRTTDLSRADVILANLTGGLLISSAPRLKKLANARARLVLSGFMTHEERDVLAAFGGFTIEHRAEEDGWLCLTLTG